MSARDRARKPWCGLAGELVWGSSLALFELLTLGGCSWWWRLHWEMLRQFRGIDPDGMVRGLRGNNPGSLAYGETPVATVRRIFELLELPRPSRVVDLGCGRGLVVLAAAAMGHEAAGVEFFSEYVERTRLVAAAMGLEVSLQAGDFLQLELPEADLYMVPSTAFPEQTRASLAERLAAVAPEGAAVVTQDWLIEHPHFQPRGSVRLPVTWGTAVFSVHRRV